MRKIVNNIALLCTLVVTTTTTATAQQSMSENIPLMVVIPEQVDALPASAVSALQSKLNQITSAAGVGSFDQYSQFCILVGVDKLTSNIVGGAPPMFTQTLAFTFNIVDQLNLNILASTSIEAKGAGTNENRAYIQCIQQLNAQSPQLKSFMSQARSKIISYYTQNCDRIIAKANTLAAMKDYEKALFLITQIPDVCTDCYAKASKATLPIYQKYVDELCVRNLAMAKSVWASRQNAEGAEMAGEYLAQIYPDAKCYGDAQLLYKEIKGKVMDDWKFTMKIYQDGIDLESQRIKAIRDIGVAWGTHQKPITNTTILMPR